MHSPISPPDAPSATTPEPPYRVSGVLAWTLVMLFLLNTMNYVDRLLFSIAQETIKADLVLSDLQLGLLGGPAFALLYVLFTFPIARLADRGNRVRIIAVALGTWSAMTAFCGVAVSFTQLLLGRAAVSVGEAGCTPAAHSLISDAFPARRRTTAIAVFGAAGPVGALLAAIVGGWLIQAHGWRMLFIVCGVMGALLAVLFSATIREPARTTAHDHSRLLPTIRLLLSKRSFAAVTLASGVAGIASISVQHYMVSFLMRVHQLQVGTASSLMGLAIGGVGIIMTLIGGSIMDHGQIRFPRIRTWLPALGMLWCGLLYAAAFQQASAAVAVALLMLGSIGQHFYMPAMYSLGQDIAPPRMRAMASAILIAATAVLGYGLGPPLIGFMSDLGAAALGARSGANAADCARLATDACAAASASGLRISLSIGSVFFVIAGGLFALAGRWVRQDLARC